MGSHGWVRPTSIEGRRAIGPAPSGWPDRTGETLTGTAVRCLDGRGRKRRPDKRRNLLPVRTPEAVPAVWWQGAQRQGMSSSPGRSSLSEQHAGDRRSGPLPRCPYRPASPFVLILHRTRLLRGGDTGHIRSRRTPRRDSADREDRAAVPSLRVSLPAGQKAVGASPHTPHAHLALTQHAEPFGQMSLFQEKGDGNSPLPRPVGLRRVAVPPSLATGRQLSLLDNGIRGGSRYEPEFWEEYRHSGHAG